jgi:hypothetical protein
MKSFNFKFFGDQNEMKSKEDNGQSTVGGLAATLARVIMAHAFGQQQKTWVAIRFI